MTTQSETLDTAIGLGDAVATAQLIRNFIAVCDRNDPEDRAIADRLRDILQREIYRRERKHYPEWIDHGGEA